MKIVKWSIHIYAHAHTHSVDLILLLKVNYSIGMILKVLWKTWIKIRLNKRQKLHTYTVWLIILKNTSKLVGWLGKSLQSYKTDKKKKMQFSLGFYVFNK